MKQQDPFLFFSNDARGIGYLADAPVQDESTTNHHEPVVERKTRISFEVHYSVILEEILSELDEMDGDNDDFVEELLFGLSLSDGDNNVHSDEASDFILCQ